MQPFMRLINPSVGATLRQGYTSTDIGFVERNKEESTGFYGVMKRVWAYFSCVNMQDDGVVLSLQSLGDINGVHGGGNAAGESRSSQYFNACGAGDHEPLISSEDMCAINLDENASSHNTLLAGQAKR